MEGGGEGGKEGLTSSLVCTLNKNGYSITETAQKWYRVINNTTSVLLYCLGGTTQQ